MMVTSSVASIYWAKNKTKIFLRLAITALVLIVGGLIYWAGDSNGFDRADDAWIKKHNAGVSALNTKIESLEKTSRSEVKELKTANFNLQARLAVEVSKTPTIVMHNSAGEVIKYGGKEIVPYLGPSFTDAWNRLNGEGEMK